MNVKELQARYPLTTLVDERGGIKYQATRSSWGWLAVDNPDTEKIIAEANLVWAKVCLLEAEYPYLYFGIFQNNNVTVWIKRLYHRSKDTIEVIDGASTGFMFNYPPDDSVRMKLTELNEQAKLSQEDDVFFCTKCQQAKSSKEYGGSYFAEMRCKGCADEKWKDQAAKETYD